MNYKELCPIGTNVRIIRIISPIGSDHEGWTVMPVRRDRRKMFIPKGYELIEGIGNVTGYELDNFWDTATPAPNRIQEKNLVIVERTIQCTLNVEWWLKEEYNEN